MHWTNHNYIALLGSYAERWHQYHASIRILSDLNSQNATSWQVQKHSVRSNKRADNFTLWCQMGHQCEEWRGWKVVVDSVIAPVVTKVPVSLCKGCAWTWCSCKDTMLRWDSRRSKHHRRTCQPSADFQICCCFTTKKKEAADRENLGSGAMK